MPKPFDDPKNEKVEGPARAFDEPAAKADEPGIDEVATKIAREENAREERRRAGLPTEGKVDRTDGGGKGPQR